MNLHAGFGAPAGLLLGRRANTSFMAPRGEVVLQVTFGPSKSPLASRAVSYARAHAEEAAEVEPGVWRASFRLEADELIGEVILAADLPLRLFR